jgi:hypothetical protein
MIDEHGNRELSSEDNASVAQLARAVRSQRAGRGFEPLHSLHIKQNAAHLRSFRGGLFFDHWSLRSNSLIREEDARDLENIAELIFDSGLSTANQLTEISGRGAGMNAVRSFIKLAGGEIHIELNRDKATGNYGSCAYPIGEPLTGYPARIKWVLTTADNFFRKMLLGGRPAS